MVSVSWPFSLVPHNRMTPNYRMTRTIPRAFSSENVQKKVPCEGRTHRSNRAGKMCTRLPPLPPFPPAPPKKSMRVKINDRQRVQKEGQHSSQMMSKNCHVIKCLSTEWGQAGQENIKFRLTSGRTSNKSNIFPPGPPTRSISTH